MTASEVSEVEICLWKIPAVTGISADTVPGGLFVFFSNRLLHSFYLRHCIIALLFAFTHRVYDIIIIMIIIFVITDKIKSSIVMCQALF